MNMFNLLCNLLHITYIISVLYIVSFLLFIYDSETFENFQFGSDLNSFIMSLQKIFGFIGLVFYIPFCHFLSKKCSCKILSLDICLFLNIIGFYYSSNSRFYSFYSLNIFEIIYLLIYYNIYVIFAFMIIITVIFLFFVYLINQLNNLNNCSMLILKFVRIICFFVFFLTPFINGLMVMIKITIDIKNLIFTITIIYSNFIKIVYYVCLQVNSNTTPKVSLSEKMLA